MTVKIKICGIGTEEALAAVIEGGADYFGLVFYEASPRNVCSSAARGLVAMARGTAASVALFVDPAPDEVARVVDDISPDYIQLHGHESPEFVAQIKYLTGRPVIKAISVGRSRDAAGGDAYAGIADILLYDAKPQTGDDYMLPGGNGVPFDWQFIESINDRGQFMLSGGLSPDNVAEAIALTRAPIVDVSSGVESARGEKDPDLIRRFIETAKSAAADAN